MKDNTHLISIRNKYTRYIIPILLISFLIIGVIDTFFYLYTINESSNNEKKTYTNAAVEMLNSCFHQFTLDSSIFLYKNTTQNAILNTSEDSGQSLQKIMNETVFYPYLSTNYTDNVYFLSKEGLCFSASASLPASTPQTDISLFQKIQELSHNYHGLPFLYKYSDSSENIYFARDVYQWTGKSHTTGTYCLGTLIIDLKSDIFDKIFLSNNPSYQFVLADNCNNIYINNTSLSTRMLQSLIKEKKSSIGQSLYTLSAIPLDLTNMQLLFITNESSIYQNARTFIFLLIFPSALSLIAIIFTNKFISKSIADDFDYFMKKLNETQFIDKDAYIYMDSSSEFAALSNVYNQTLSRIQALSEKIHEQEILTKNIEIESLQAQINPHFLYNTLNCISGLVDMDRKEDCHHALLALADIERMSLKGKPFCTIEEDLHYVKEYAYIQQLRFEKQLSILIDIPQNLYRYIIPKLVIQPLIENAVIHGTSKISGHGMIVVLGSTDGVTLQIMVKDNGPGFSNEQLNNFKSISRKKQTVSYGLHNIDRRLKLYYGEQYGLILKNNEKNGSCVTVRIPLNIYENNTIERM